MIVLTSLSFLYKFVLQGGLFRFGSTTKPISTPNLILGSSTTICLCYLLSCVVPHSSATGWHLIFFCCRSFVFRSGGNTASLQRSSQTSCTENCFFDRVSGKSIQCLYAYWSSSHQVWMKSRLNQCSNSAFVKHHGTVGPELLAQWSIFCCALFFKEITICFVGSVSQIQESIHNNVVSGFVKGVFN